MLIRMLLLVALCAASGGAGAAPLLLNVRPGGDDASPTGPFASIAGARDALRALRASGSIDGPVRVVVEEPVSIGAKLTHFLRAVVTPRADGSLGTRLTGPQGSGILTSMSLANALLVVPEDRGTVPAGERLSALLLTEDAGTAEGFAL